MYCPICAALNREHSQECQVEASATIKTRSELLGRSADASSQDQLNKDVQRSRKRLAHFAFKLHQHRIRQHPGMARAAAG